MSLFLSRGIAALKKERGLKVFLSFGQKPNEETFRMQDAIHAHGLVITEIHKAFNTYEGASLLGNIGQMLILASTDHTKALVAANKAYDEKIYTGEMRAQNSVYRCRGCGADLAMGVDSANIEALKESGCPQCGGTVFDRRQKPAPERGAAKEKRALGEHILADFFGCDSAVLASVADIKTHMHEAAKRSNATIITEEFHEFKPWGVSGAVIIKESHLTIHTWPEHGYAAVDLFTCGDSLDLLNALHYLRDSLKCDHMESADIARGLFKYGGLDSAVNR
jgi:S-adenosylmethionine decarboxylase proenzyme